MEGFGRIRLTAVKIAGLYALLGFVWLLGLDRLMDALGWRHVEELADLLFMLLTGGLFYWMICRFLRRHDKIQQDLAREHALAEQTRLMQKHNRTLQDINRRLSGSNAELEQFAYVASHDLREPLRQMQAYATLLSQNYAQSLDADGQEFLHYLADGAKRMDRLIVDLLEYCRAGNGCDPSETVDLGQSLAQAADNLEIAIEESGAVVTIPPNCPTLIGDQGLMVRLFQNLIGNAIKYRSPERPPVISITVEKTDSQCYIAIRDNGIGIDPVHFQRIFRIFQRLHGRGEYDGTGIGLAICKKIAERLGGRIEVDSLPGQGSVFTVILPTE